MGLLRFTVWPPGHLNAEMVEHCFLSGLDRIPWKIQARQEGDQLVIQRAADDSTNLHIPWDVPSHGRLMLSTASLMERAEPYLLPLELARGKIGQLRNQLAEWQALGLVVPEAVQGRVAEALTLFGQAVIQAGARPGESAELADQALYVAVEAAAILAVAYADQAIGVRRRLSGRVPFLLGANLGLTSLEETAAGPFLQAFNAAVAPVNWREIEPLEGAYAWAACDRQLQWCRQRGLTIYSGPLLQFDRHTMPEWLYVWEGEFDDILTFATEFLEQAVSRYRGQVDLWQCASRMHSTELLALSEEERLRLTARALEVTRALDPERPLLVAFDQPWGEYLSQRDADFPPLQFADALIRSGLGLGGLVLELPVGYAPGGCFPRDPLDLSRQLDYWATLGLPLHIALCIPSAESDDPLAVRRAKCVGEPWSPKLQQAWLARWLPILLSKPYIAGLLWTQLRDAEPHEFPHGGLFDLRRQPKPALRTLEMARQEHLR